MGWKDITAGDKLAKPINARFIKSQKTGNAAIEVAFAFQESSTETEETLPYQFWLTKDSVKFSMQTLVELLGYNGSRERDQAGKFLDPNVLNWDSEVKLVVILDPYIAKDGSEKEAPKIKYVNAVIGSSYEDLGGDELEEILSDIGFEEAFQSVKSGVATAGPVITFGTNPDPRIGTGEIASKTPPKLINQAPGSAKRAIQLPTTASMKKDKLPF